MGRFALWFTVFMGVLAVGLLIFFLRDVQQQTRTKGPSVPIVAPDARFPGPGVRVESAEDLARLRQSEEQLLGSYAWVDRRAGIVRIPIDRAMTLVASRGLPVRRNDGR
ncbi:hypothetical protein D3C87_1878270 [compost metagenome]